MALESHLVHYFIEDTEKPDFFRPSLFIYMGSNSVEVTIFWLGSLASLYKRALLEAYGETKDFERRKN